MLQLIVGPAHSGKTGLLRARIQERARAGKRAVLLVPEQASFANEKALALLLGPDAARAQVLSFTRMAELLLRELGGAGRRAMNEAAAYLLMSVALDELSDELFVYKRHYQSRGFIEQMVATASEFSYAGISPAALSAFSFSQPAGSLREKAYELSLIFDAYDAIVRQSYLPENDLLTLAAERLTGSGYFAETEIIIDDFAGFTAPELTLIEAMLAQSPCVAAALCSDAVKSRAPAFSLADDTARRLLRAAERAGVAAESIVLDRDGMRGMPAGLTALERAERAERAAERVAVPDGSVRSLAAPDPVGELTLAAAAIARMVREEGLRYRDIAVIARDLTRYQTLLPPIFARYEIPFFLDARADAKSSALSAGLLSAVQLAAGTGGDPLLLAKSPLLGIDAEAAGELENYSFVWSVSGRGWNAPFLNHPDGLLEAGGASVARRLDLIEQSRQRVIEPVLRLRARMRDADGTQFARAVWDYLQEIDAAEHLTAFGEELEPVAREEFFAQQSLLWEQLVDILELFSTLPQTLRLTLGRAAELLELALGTVQIATPPRTLDQVSVGLADRMRPDDPKAVVLLGVIEGEFPAVAAPGGLLSDAERRRMVEGGLELLAEGERFLAQERMLCYRAVTAAAQTLLVCAPRAETTGEPLSPSAIWLRAAALSSVQEEEMSVVQTADSAMTELAVSLGDRGVQAETLRVLAEDIAPEQLTRLWRAREKSPHRLENRSVAQRLFGSRMRLSPSRLERYYSCPFSYFAQSGLRLRPRRKAELSPLETGTLVHRVLEQMVSQHGGKGLAALDDATIQQEIDAMTRQYLSERLPDPGAITKRLEHSFRRVGEWLFELVRRLGEEFSQSRFEPIAFEMPIGEGQTVEPLVLTTASGTEILVEGTVDRVDVAEVEGRRYVRVIDYKSGGKSFSLSDVYHGLNMQMLLYLFSIWQNGEKELENVLPAGILYAPALGKYHAVPRGDDGGQLRRAADAQYRMNGLLLSDPAVLSAMEADGKGIFIPVRAGQEKSDALASLAELGRLRRLVEDRVIAMADQLAEGEIAACPSQKKNDRPCRFCDYRGICGFEEGDPVRPVLELDRAVLLAEGENDG